MTLTQTTPSQDSARLVATAASHAAIVDAIAAGDPATAAGAMKLVIEEGRRSRRPIASVAVEKARDDM